LCLMLLSGRGNSRLDFDLLRCKVTSDTTSSSHGGSPLLSGETYCTCCHLTCQNYPVMY